MTNSEIFWRVFGILFLIVFNYLIAKEIKKQDGNSETAWAFLIVEVFFILLYIRVECIPKFNNWLDNL